MVTLCIEQAGDGEGLKEKACQVAGKPDLPQLQQQLLLQLLLPPPLNHLVGPSTPTTLSAA